MSKSLVFSTETGQLYIESCISYRFSSQSKFHVITSTSSIFHYLSIIPGLGSGAFGQVTRCSATFRRSNANSPRVQVALKILKHKDEISAVGRKVLLGCSPSEIASPRPPPQKKRLHVENPNWNLKKKWLEDASFSFLGQTSFFSAPIC